MMWALMRGGLQGSNGGEKGEYWSNGNCVGFLKCVW